MDRYSYISNAEGSYIDELYQKYKSDPSSVDQSWQKFFEGFEFSQQKFGPNGQSVSGTKDSSLTSKEVGVRNLIHSYRSRAHLKSDTNPIRPRRKHKVLLDIEDFGLSQKDLDTEFEVGEVIGIGKATLRNILENLQKSRYLVGFRSVQRRCCSI